MENNSQKSDSEGEDKALDTSKYNSSGIVFSKPEEQNGSDKKLPEDTESIGKETESSVSGEQKEKEQQEKGASNERPNLIRSIRTYEKDLEEARMRSGLESGSKETQDVLSRARQQAEQAQKKRKASREEIKQELAKSGIVPSEEGVTPPAEKKTSLKTVRTYRDDATSSIQDKKLSVVSIAAAESKKRTEQGRRLRPERIDSPTTFTKSLTVIVTSVVLIASGIAVSVFFYKISKEGSGITAKKEISSLVFADEQKEIDITDLTRTNLLKKLNDERLGANTSLGGVVHLLLTEKGLGNLEAPASTERFLRKVSGSVPNRLIRSLEGEFMLGVYVSVGNHPFLIFKTPSFENAFASMLDWERTMNRDLSPLFGDTLAEISTQSATLSRIFTPRVFNDVIVRNNDTRILRDDRGDIALIYGFPNVGTIIVATNENTYFEVFKRLTVTKSENE